MPPAAETMQVGREPGDGEPLIAVEDLCLRFPRVYGDVDVLDHVGLEIAPGASLGLVGESGSGKSLLGLSIVGLSPRGAAVSGSIRFRGEEMTRMREHRLRTMRGPGVAMIYQDALTSLDPSFTIGNALAEAGRLGSDYEPAELLELVSVPGGRRILGSYPHELSGGQRQRVLIALALARHPALVIADEPTTALDVTVQAQIVALLRRLQEEVGFSLLLVSHDLGLVAQLADRIAVMYAGQIVEVGPTEELIADPRHPYTRGLLDARLSLERRDSSMHVIPGTVPSPRAFPSGCRFRDRCERAAEDCAERRPEPVDDGKDVYACFHPLPRKAVR
jgi:oligopeptide/dipeptide ABC transporter ATP-binding protein